MCRYNMVQNNKILCTAPQRLGQNLIRAWINKKHPIPHHHGWVVGCLCEDLGENGTLWDIVIVYRCRIARIEIPIAKIRRPLDRIIFIMVDLCTWKADVYIETGSSMPANRKKQLVTIYVWLVPAKLSKFKCRCHICCTCISGNFSDILERLLDNGIPSAFLSWTRMHGMTRCTN